MQDLDQASLQRLLIGVFANTHTIWSAKVPASLRLSLAAVPAELLVDGLVFNVDEEGEAILRQLGQVGGHRDLRDLVEILERDHRPLPSG